MQLDASLTKLYQKLGLDLPTSQSHGVTSDNLSDHMRRVQTKNWRMVAPGLLEADTDYGTLTQRVPNDVICTGTSPDGMPLLAKISI